MKKELKKNSQRIKKSDLECIAEIDCILYLIKGFLDSLSKQQDTSDFLHNKKILTKYLQRIKLLKEHLNYSTENEDYTLKQIKLIS